VTADEVQRRLAVQPAPVVLDVRSRREYRRGHLPGAHHLPFWAVSFRRLPLRDPALPVIVYCGHGPRAWMASLALRARGWTDVSLLEGHFVRWRRQGRRVVRS
jgi:rhodanese-related sulfurtransferase